MLFVTRSFVILLMLMLFVSVYSFIEARNEVSFIIYRSFIYPSNKVSCTFTLLYLLLFLFYFHFIIIIMYKLYRRYTLPVSLYFIYSFFFFME